jgi:AcrR family transcriptional regulator
MAQVKKPQVREAILKSAYKLFKRRGYAATTTAQIAAGAGVSESNVYVYFKSKFQILFDLYEPWMRERIQRLQAELDHVNDPRHRLRLILTMLWSDVPSEDNGFTNNVMQALSTIGRKDRYRPDLLRWIEENIESMILSAIPQRRRDELTRGRIGHILMMAQDGFALNYHLDPESRCNDATIEFVCDLLIGPPR